MSEDQAKEDLVVVFHAHVPELLPLAETALEQAAIDYTVHGFGAIVPSVFGHAPEFGGAEGAADVLVKAEDAARAREILADLSRGTVAAAPAPPPASRPSAPADRSSRPYRLYDSATKAVLGEITAAQLQFLEDELEEDSETDQDYYIDGATVEMLEAAGADTDLAALLRRALHGRDGLDITWTPA
jgi:hypothetical protein